MNLESWPSIATFLLFLIVFAGLGLLASRRTQGEDEDYLLAGRDTPPVLVALSAAATKYSGYIFIALMGYIFTNGLSAIWLVTGFLFGDLLAFSGIHRQVHRAALATRATTFPDLLARWAGGHHRRVRIAVALLTLVFLITYAAAQFSAGGKALEVLFGWNGVAGAILGAGVVLTYSFSGGLRASIWTDSLQALLMLGAMVLLLFVAIHTAGGLGGFWQALSLVSPTHLDLGRERFGSSTWVFLFAIGWLFNGLGVVGQPHIMVRFMALDPTANTRRVAIPYFAWTFLFVSSAFWVGMATPVFLGTEMGFDPELALPTLAAQLIPGVAVGVVIGGIFASSLSTADSQVLACSAALSDDLALMKGPAGRRWATFIVVAGALAIAIFASSSVFELVIFAWSALACGFGPLVIVLALGGKPSETLALAMIATGLATALGWRELGYNAWLYEGLPGMVAGFVIYAMGSLLLGPKVAQTLPPRQSESDDR